MLCRVWRIATVKVTGKGVMWVRSGWFWDIFFWKCLCFVCVIRFLSIFLLFCESGEPVVGAPDRGALQAKCAFGNMAGYSMEQGRLELCIEKH